ncbi:MAG: hypothetical protein ABIZ34_07160 [Candidatus Limnocylindrales bacterium]
MPMLVVALAGVIGVVVGLGFFAAGESPFDIGRALNGLLGQLSTTLPAALAVSLAAAMEIGGGAVLVRLVRWSAYGSWSEAIVSGVIGALAKDTMLLLLLGAIGHFQPLVLAVLDLALIAVGLFLRPFIQRGEARAGTGGTSGSVSFATGWSMVGWAVVIAVWAIPVIIQLASPVVPFADGIANHVAPIEHLQTYHAYGSLAVSPAPNYGSAGLSLGYIAFVGSVVSLTSLPTTLAVAAFALPLAVVLAAAGSHLAGSLAGGRAGSWTLLTVPLTFAFLRLPDASAVVLAMPLAAASIVLVAGGGRRFAAPFLGGRSLPILAAGSLGATVLVHPLVGLFAGLTMLALALVRPAAPRRVILAGILGGLVVAAPELAIVAGIQASALVGAVAWPIGLLFAAWLAGAGPRRGDLAETLPPARSFGFVLLVLLVLGAISGAALLSAAALKIDPRFPQELLDGGFWAATRFPLLLVAALVGVVLLRDLRAWLILGICVIVAAALVVAANLAPADTQIGAAIASELPESAGYWIPWLLALAAGIGLAELWSREAWPATVRVGVTALAIGVAAFPLRPVTAVDGPNRELPYATTLATSLGIAETGYWRGYPDTRRLIDADGASLVAAIRAEQASGRLGATTAVLHITPSFQQWLATPIGVLTGAMETDLTDDSPTAIPADGSRIFGRARVRESLGAAYPYLVIEGYATAAGFDGMAMLAGYRPVASGNAWRMLRLGD